MVQKSIRQDTPPNIIGQPNPVFDENAFDASIWNHGYDIVVEKAIQCPCKDKETGKNLPTCQNCRGVGWFFINPIETKGIVTGINDTLKYKAYSPEFIGDISLTIRNNIRLSYMDRIIFKNDYSILSENKIVREFEDTGTKYFIFLSYEAYQIEDVFVFQGEDKALIRLTSSQYSVNSNNGFVLDLDYDFTTITKFSGNVGIRYKHEKQHHVVDLPHDFRRSFKIDVNGKEEKLLLPVNAICRVAHQVLDLANYDGDGIIDNSYL